MTNNISEFTFWKPLPGETSIQGKFVGLIDWEAGDGQTGTKSVPCIVIDNGNEDYIVLPSWFLLMNAFRANVDKVKVGCIIRVEVVGERKLQGKMPMKIIRLFLDGEEVGRYKLTTSGEEIARKLLSTCP